MVAAINAATLEAQIGAVGKYADAAGAATAAKYPSLTLSVAYGRGGFDWATFASPAGGDLGRRRLAHSAALSWRCAAGARATVSGGLQGCRRAVPVDRADRFSVRADTLVSLEDDAKELEQTRRSADALNEMRQELEGRYASGSAPL